MSILEAVGQLEVCVELTGRTEKTIAYEVHTQAQSSQGTRDNYFTDGVGTSDTLICALVCSHYLH